MSDLDDRLQEAAEHAAWAALERGEDLDDQQVQKQVLHAVEEEGIRAHREADQGDLLPHVQDHDPRQVDLVFDELGREGV